MEIFEIDKSRLFRKAYACQYFHCSGTEKRKLADIIRFLDELRVFHNDEFFQPLNDYILFTAAGGKQGAFAMRKHRNEVNHSSLLSGKNGLCAAARLVNKRQQIVRGHTVQ